MNNFESNAGAGWLSGEADKPTPETDANEKWANSCSFEERWEMQVCESDFARKLERERDEASFQLELAMGGWKTERDSLRTEVEQLRKQNEMDTIRFREMQEHGERREVENEQLRKVAQFLILVVVVVLIIFALGLLFNL